MAEKIWADDAWDSYIEWQTSDKKILKKINDLLKDIERNGNLDDKGSPEPLKGNLSEYYSRQITEKDRLVYKFADNKLYIAQCKGHYGDK